MQIEVLDDSLELLDAHLLLLELVLQIAIVLPGLVARLAHRLAVLPVALGLGHPVSALLPEEVDVVQLRGRYATKSLSFLNSATCPGLHLILLTRGLDHEWRG